MAESNSKSIQNQHENYELKPCPFCASETAEPQTSYYHDGTGKVSPRYSVRCNGCGSSTKGYIKEGQAIDAWNIRTPQKEG